MNRSPRSPANDPYALRRVGVGARSVNMTDTDFILSDLGNGEHQTSWDWPADQRFARFLADRNAVEVYDALLRSVAPFPIQIVAQKTVDHIRRRRLRALRQLAKTGKIESYWRGTADGGRTEFGVCRVRVYRLASHQP